ncbi:MAG TPA: D-glycero-beta-D-manno-heptose 1-phosphate adenylyltransferase, partial [Dehalococcoidia bacterium]
GAGDSVLAALALALAAGAGNAEALELAAAAGAVAVSRPGTTACTAQELAAELSGPQKFAGSLAALVERVAALRAGGRRIVFTNGCFDLLHRGHVTYLNQARALGDALIVGLNSDESVRRLKGPGRPVVPLHDRVAVLAALSCVDAIGAFEEDTPAELIRAVRPEVFVKGGDYTHESLPEAALVEALGGTVWILPYLPDRSTSGLIERIARETAAPAGSSSALARRPA